MRGMRGVCAAAALVLAAGLPGEGRAQANPVVELLESVDREGRSCGDWAPYTGTAPTIFDNAPAGARCFREYRLFSLQEWQARLRDAMICDAVGPSCLGAADAVIDEGIANTARVVIVGDTEVRREANAVFSGGNLNPFALPMDFSTISRTEAIIRQDVLLRSDAFETRVTGRLDTGAPLFDQTYAGAVTDPAAVQGLADAALAVTTTGGPGVTVLTPVLIERTETLLDRQVETVRAVQGDPVETVTFSTLVGASSGLVNVPYGLPSAEPGIDGDFGLCETSGRTGGNFATDRPMGCANEGQLLVVPQDTAITVINTNTHSDILETVTTTEIWRIFEQWEVVGVLRALGEIHAAVQSGARDLGQRLLRRMGDEAQAPRGFALAAPGATLSGMGGPGVALHGWVEGYGLRGRVDATGGTEAERRHAAGIAAGLTWVRPDGLTWGLALDHGRGGTDIAAAGESADIRLTQGAVMLGMHRPGGFVSGALTFGAGEVTATTTLGGAATATYDLRTLGAQVEAGWHLTAGDWRLTPSAGLDWTRVRTGAFAAGGIAAAAHDADRTRVFAGIAARRDWRRGDGVLSFDASARVVHVLGGTDRMLPVAGGLAIDAAPEGRTGVDLGLGLRWIQRGTEARIGYVGRFRDGARDHGLTAGLAMRW